MYKTNAKICWALFVLPIMLLCFGLAFVFGASDFRATAQPIYNPMTLGGDPVSIDGATVVFNEDASYTGSQKSIVSYITIGEGDEAVNVYNMTGDTVNYNIEYTRDGVNTQDLTHVGTLGVVIKGVGNYTGTITTTFTITPMDVNITWADDTNLVVDDTAAESLANGTGLGVFVVKQGTEQAINDDSIIVTYYNTDKGIFSNGFTSSGSYIVSAYLNNPDLNVVGETSKKVYVKAKVLTNSDASIKVINEDGFEKGVTFGEASVTTNQYTINARADIDNPENVQALINLTLYKNGAIYTPSEDLTIVIKTGKLDYSCLNLCTNNGATTKFEPIDYTVSGDTITFKAKDLNTFVLQTEEESS